MTNALVTQREITPASWQMLTAIAETSATATTERQKIAKQLLFCYENDLPLSLAVNGGLYTVKNRVEVEGTVIRAQIRKHPDYDYEIVKLTETECDIAILQLKRVDTGKIISKFEWNQIGMASFTKEDAKLAGLWDKDVWAKYPQDMLLNRATSRAYKRFCPDIFFQSVYVCGEISGDEAVIVEGETIPTMGDLIAEYGHDAVLDAVNEGGNDLADIQKYLIDIHDGA